jgi:uroporphyrin-III C-methyltransferase
VNIPAALLDPARLGAREARPGTVHLVGGGPGDPALLTVRAAALLATCDLVAYDRLAPVEVLDLVPPQAERICVGKTVDRPGWSQEQTNRLLVEQARAGKAVVRLKGGDPYVFGRGGEEALACRAAGVDVEVVSGVSSAVAAPAAAGIPVTHRGVATGVAFITGHEDPAKDDHQIDWEALARFHGTLVFLMGVGNLGRITGMLLAHGRAPDTPVAVVRWGTTGRQETITGDLVGITDEVRRARITSPATVVVGEVVDLAEVLAPVAPGAPAAAAAPADTTQSSTRDPAHPPVTIPVNDDQDRHLPGGVPAGEGRSW